MRTADSVPSERSTCGFRRRLFKKDDGVPVSVTHLSIHDAREHWHEHTHEYYYVLHGSGILFIDGEPVQVEAGDCVWIKPGARHYAQGELESLIIASPAYDVADTHFADSASLEPSASI
ncbi:MAG: cupin domain-containing protein [Candidatus Hydrogenedentes bacterium]|nr:cupin domain-containing protein [Candidatus Hydrogenedentota bacterium]